MSLKEPTTASTETSETCAKITRTLLKVYADARRQQSKDETEEPLADSVKSQRSVVSNRAGSNSVNL